MNKRTLNHISIVSVIIGFLLLMHFTSLFNNAIANSDQVPIPLNKLPSQSIYWLGILSVAFPLLFQDINKKVKVFSIFILSVYVFLAFPLFFTMYDYPSGRDSIYSYQLADVIYSDGYWNTESVTGIAKQYSHYPAMHIFVVVVSKITGIPLIKIFTWLLPILRLFTIPSLIYLIFREFIAERVSLLCVFLYLTNPSLINWVHHEGFAIIFFMISLYILIKLNKKTTSTHLVFLNLVFGLMLVLSHHFTAYVWFAWVAVLFVSSKIPVGFFNRHNIDSKRYVSISNNYILFFLVAFSSWGAYVTNLDMIATTVDVVNVLTKIFNPLKYVTQPYSLGISFWFYEKVFLYSSIIIFGIFTVIGMFVILQKILGKSNNERFPLFFAVNFIFSVLLVMASAILWATEYYFILLRIFEFAYIGIIPVTVLGIMWISSKGKLYKNLIVPLSLIVLLIGGNIMNGGFRYYYVNRSVISSSNAIFLTPEIYGTSIWFKNNYRGGSVLGDGLIYDAIGGFGKSDVNMYNKELIQGVFGSDYINESTLYDLRANNITYIVTHRYMTEYPSYEISDMIYTDRQIKKFEYIYYLEKIYDNEAISIYEISKNWSVY